MTRNNSFDLIRHLAALAVLFSHQFALSGLPEPTVGLTSLGGLGVMVFFAISGFLITASWNRSKSFSEYLSKRIRRIFPALIVCCLIMIYVIAPIFSSRSAMSYIFSMDSLEGFFSYALLQFRYPFISDFGADYIFKNAINGSLWTLKFEFFDYILIAMVLFSKRSMLLKSVFILIIAIVVFKLSGVAFERDYYIYRAAMTTIPFATGSIIYCSGVTKLKSWWLALPVSIMTITISYYLNEYASFQIGVSILTLYLGMKIKDRLINGKFDISYGIYIYAFPIQQLVINELHLGFLYSLALCAILTLVAGILSWEYVEKPFIIKSRARLESAKSST